VRSSTPRKVSRSGEATVKQKQEPKREQPASFTIRNRGYRTRHQFATDEKKLIASTLKEAGLDTWREDRR